MFLSGGLMIIIKKRKYGISIYQKWFSDYIKWYDAFTIIMYKQIPFPHNTGIICSLFKKETFYTLITDLTLSYESIFDLFSSTVRNEIRRCEKENVTLSFSEKIENFISIYNSFAVIKDLPLQSLSNMKTYEDKLIITSVSLDGIILVVHSYLCDKDLKITRLLHSGSCRFSDKVDKNMIARVNKYLHYQDIKYFKENNFSVYDWGGISSSENGIDKFKSSFGGKKIIQYNYYSYFYYLLMKINGFKF
jgi:hypothetical protein